MKLRSPFVLRSTHDAALLATNKGWEQRSEEIAEELLATRIVDGHLTEDLAAAKAALAEEQRVSESLARQIQDMAEAYCQLTVLSEVQEPADDGWQVKYEAERKRADHLQQQLDDALGLNDSRVADGRHWQHTRIDKKGAAL